MKMRRTNKDAAPVQSVEAQQPSRPRRYLLTPEGMASLRSSAQRAKPWERSTGPRTPEGKAQSSKNAAKHGERSAEVIAQRHELNRALRLVNGFSG